MKYRSLPLHSCRCIVFECLDSNLGLNSNLFACFRKGIEIKKRKPTSRPTQPRSRAQRPSKISRPSAAHSPPSPRAPPPVADGWGPPLICFLAPQPRLATEPGSSSGWTPTRCPCRVPARARMPRRPPSPYLRRRRPPRRPIPCTKPPPPNPSRPPSRARRAAARPLPVRRWGACQPNRVKVRSTLVVLARDS
jgi:hypothetical protein